jgi:hypothetical protein
MNPRVSLSLLVLCLALSASASASNVSVSCTSPKPGTFPSISAALNALNPAGPNLITVQGTCKENVFIAYYQRLTITSAPGLTAVIENAASPAGIVLQAFGCRGLVLLNLEIRGGTVGLLVNQASEAVIQNLVVEDNTSDGAVAQVNSTLGVESSKFIHNGGNGLTVASMSNATLATSPGETILFARNGLNGIDVDASYLQVNFGTIRVEHNAGAAMAVSNGQLLMFGPISAGVGNVFANNGEGIDLFDTSSARFFGGNLIENNGEVGLQVVNGSSADFISLILPDGTVSVTTIEGHSGPGANVVRSSAADFNGPHIIRHNGSASDVLASGIRVEHSNVSVESGATVAGNTGPGIVAEESSTVNVTAGAVIRNNSGDGVHFRIQSNGGFFQPISIVGNGGASIACDTSSLAFGDFTGIKNVSCSQLPSSESGVTKSRVVMH